MKRGEGLRHRRDGACRGRRRRAAAGVRPPCAATVAAAMSAAIVGCAVPTSTTSGSPPAARDRARPERRVPRPWCRPCRRHRCASCGSPASAPAVRARVPSPRSAVMRRRGAIAKLFEMCVSFWYGRLTSTADELPSRSRTRRRGRAPRRLMLDTAISADAGGADALGQRRRGSGRRVARHRLPLLPEPGGAGAARWSTRRWGRS